VMMSTRWSTVTVGMRAVSALTSSFPTRAPYSG
jgi:hypothetical protein